MDETKQNDTANRGQTGPPRIPGPVEGEVTDILCAAGHAYQVVYPQEPSWVLYLRLTAIDGNNPRILRIILRPLWPVGSGGWFGEAKFYPAIRKQQ